MAVTGGNQRWDLLNSLVSLFLLTLQCGQGFSQQENGHCMGELPAAAREQGRGQTLPGECQPELWQSLGCRQEEKGGEGKVLFVPGAPDAKTTAM